MMEAEFLNSIARYAEETMTISIVWQYAGEISDEDLRHAVQDALDSAPHDFWRWAKPADFPEGERQEAGSIKHTVQLCSMADDAARWMAQATGQPFQTVRDWYLAAVIVHDLFRSDDRANHPQLAAKKIPKRFAIVRRAVETHMGPWYDDWPPESYLGWIVHFADYWESRDTAKGVAWDPAPR